MLVGPGGPGPMAPARGLVRARAMGDAAEMPLQNAPSRSPHFAGTAQSSARAAGRVPSFSRPLRR